MSGFSLCFRRLTPGGCWEGGSGGKAGGSEEALGETKTQHLGPGLGTPSLCFPPHPRPGLLSLSPAAGGGKSRAGKADTH